MLCANVNERLVSQIVSCIEREDSNNHTLIYINFLQNLVMCKGQVNRYFQGGNCFG